MESRALFHLATEFAVLDRQLADFIEPAKPRMLTKRPIGPLDTTGPRVRTRVATRLGVRVFVLEKRIGGSEQPLSANQLSNWNLKPL